jgi:hypothetical protein
LRRMLVPNDDVQDDRQEFIPYSDKSICRGTDHTST